MSIECLNSCNLGEQEPELRPQLGQLDGDNLDARIREQEDRLFQNLAFLDEVNETKLPMSMPEQIVRALAQASLLADAKEIAVLRARRTNQNY